jgi:hypothetical protein
MKIISGKQATARRILLYGIHGVGKSTWAASAPNPIFINMEDGLADIECDKTEPVETFSQAIQYAFWLYNEPHDYRTVVVDTIDWLEKCIFREISQKAGTETVQDIDFGKGAPRAIPRWEQLLESLDRCRKYRGMNVILLGHSKLELVKNPEGSEYHRYAPDLWTNARGEGTGAMIQEWCDEVLFAQFKTYTTEEGKGIAKKVKAVGGKERAIRCCESATAMAKNRIGLPEELPMEWEAYAKYVRASYATRGQKKPKPQPEIPPPDRVDISGMVVDGSSKVPAAKSAEVQEMEEAFSTP